MNERISATPYPGLRPFSPAESEIFFGREAQTDRLLEQLARHRFLAIVGAGGCGKSSLVSAGLVTAIRLGLTVNAGAAWRVARMRPGADPYANLACALAADDVLPRDAAGAIDVAALSAVLARCPNGLVDALRAAHWPSHTPLLVVVDAFDDLFRVRGAGVAGASAGFVELLLRSTAQTGLPVHVAITLRTDFLGECARFPGLPEAIVEGQVIVPRMTHEQCRAAICAPAGVFNAEVEPALVERLLDECSAAADDLPLLQHGLARLWAAQSEAAPLGIDATAEPARRVLTLAAFERSGGLARMLDEHAEATLRALGPDEQRIAQLMFRRLTQRGVGPHPDARVPATLADIAAVAGVPPEAVMPVVEAFRRADRGFLLPPPEEPLTAQTSLDLVHEALLHHWRTLADWMRVEDASAAHYRRLAETASLWDRGEAALWTGPDLDGALAWERAERPSAAWAARYGSTFAFALAQRFLQASEAQRDRPQASPPADADGDVADPQPSPSSDVVPTLDAVARSARHAARLRPRIGGLIIAVGAALMLAAILNHQGRDAAETAAPSDVEAAVATRPAAKARATGARSESPRIAADARTLVTAASEALPVDPELGALLALEARDLVATSGPGEPPAIAADATVALARALAIMHGTGVTRGPADAVYIAAFSPDGRWLATADHAHVIHVWNRDDGKTRATLRGHANWIGSLAFSPDGKRLVSASSWEASPRVWEIDRANAKPAMLEGHRDGILAAAFAADGGRVLTASLDGKVRSFDAATGRSTIVFALADRAPHRVAFSADGRWLAEAKSDRTVRVRGIASKRASRDLGPVADGIASLAFDASGDYVFAMGREGSLHAWAVKSGHLASALQADAGRLRSAALRQDAGVLVAAGADNTAEVFDAPSGRKLGVLAGHRSPVLAARFAGTPGNEMSTIATVGADGVARTWSVPTLVAAATRLPLRKSDGPLEIALFSDDGSLVATAGAGATRVAVYDAGSGAPLWSMPPSPRDHRQPVTNFAFSSDGHWLVTTSHDGVVKVWDARSGFHVADLPGHRGSVNAAAFGPDAREVISAGADGTARVWAVAKRTARLTLDAAAGPLREAAFGSDGTMIAVAPIAGATQLWRADTGARVAQLAGTTGGVDQVAWQRARPRLLTVGKDATVRFWDAAGAPSTSLPMGPGRALHVTQSADGAWIAAAFADGTVRIGDVERGAAIARWPVHSTWVNDAVFLPDGRTVRTIGGDGVVRDVACTICLPERALIELARARLAGVKRELSDDERLRFRVAPPVVSAPRAGMVSESGRGAEVR